MPVNFTPYIPQATDLLTPAMNMVKLKQNQEEMGLMRDYRAMQMQQMVQQKEQQAKENEWKDFEQRMQVLSVYEKADPTDELLYKNLTKIFPPEKYGVDWSGMPIEEMKNYKQAIKEALKFHKQNPSDFTKKTVEMLAADIRTKFPSMPQGYEASIAEMEKGVQPPQRKIEEIGKRGYEVSGYPGEQLLPVTPESTETPKEYAPELKKFVKGKQVRDVDMNKPSDVAKARAEGFTEYIEPERGRETAGEAAAKAAARTSAGLKAWKVTFKEMMGRDPTKEEIRRKLINDPYGLLEPEQETPVNVAPPVNLLKEGKKTTFQNGQIWTLQKGKPVQLK
jgi:hypothetical protein